MDVQIEDIKKVVEQVIKNYKLPQEKILDYNTLILVPDFISDEQILSEALKDDKKSKIVATAKPLSGGVAADTEIVDVNEERNQDMLMRGLAKCMEYIIVTPGPGFIKRASQFDDKCFFCHLTFRALASGKKVSIFSDINKETIRTKAYEDISLALENLSAMGAELIYADTKTSKEQGSNGGLITEKEIISAYKDGIKEIRTGNGSIVTPLAYDAARERDIIIIKES